MNIQELEKLMKSHDWYYDFTASGNQWRNSNEEKKRIYAGLQDVGETKAKQLWNKYAPKNKAASGPMFPFPKYLFRKNEATQKLKEIIYKETKKLLRKNQL